MRSTVVSFNTSTFAFFFEISSRAVFVALHGGSFGGDTTFSIISSIFAYFDHRKRDSSNTRVSVINISGRALAEDTSSFITDTILSIIFSLSADIHHWLRKSLFALLSDVGKSWGTSFSKLMRDLF